MGPSLDVIQLSRGEDASDDNMVGIYTLSAHNSSSYKSYQGRVWGCEPDETVLYWRQSSICWLDGVGRFPCLSHVTYPIFFKGRFHFAFTCLFSAKWKLEWMGLEYSQTNIGFAVGCALHTVTVLGNLKIKWYIINLWYFFHQNQEQESTLFNNWPG